MRFLLVPCFVSVLSADGAGHSARSGVMCRVMFSNLHSENSAAIALFMLFTLWIYSALRLLSDAARLNEGKK